MERADLSARLDLEHTAPVSETPVVQGRSSSSGQEGKSRHRPKSLEKEAPGKELEEAEEPDRDRPRHKIDSLG
jgi:hypothetical protein